MFCCFGKSCRVLRILNVRIKSDTRRTIWFKCKLTPPPPLKMIIKYLSICFAFIFSPNVYFFQISHAMQIICKYNFGGRKMTTPSSRGGGVGHTIFDFIGGDDVSSMIP